LVAVWLQILAAEQTMGGARSLAPALLRRARHVNMSGVDEYRNDVARDDKVVWALLSLLQPDEHKPLLADLVGDLVVARNPVPGYVDVCLCRAAELESVMPGPAVLV